GGSGSGGTSADSGPSSSSQGTPQVPHDRNANSYVMLGTFNLPVNIMDPQQIQSEPRLRLVLAENLLRDIQDVINRMEEREEDQRTLVQICECLRLLGNALVALSDLRLNLMSPVPRHLHVVRPFSHYTSPVNLPGAVHHHIPVQMNLGATVAVAANSTEGQAPPSQPISQPEQAGQGQTSPSQTTLSNQQAGQGQGGPRVIRISHQAVPVVMMQMNTDGPGSNSAAGGQQIPGQPASHAGPQQPQARVVFSRPPFAASMPPPAFGTRGTTINVRAAMPGQQPGQDLAPDLGQLLGSLLGVAGVPGAGSAGTPSITVTTSGVPAFIQGVTEFMQQASQPIFSPPPPTSGTTQAPAGPNPAANPAAAAAESLNPELFTGIVRGVLSTMMGSLGQAQNDTESIAQFMQRLSQATNIFISPEDPTGFFGELLMLVCQTFTMSDLVMLLHGQHQPLSRIQPQLSQFFTQNYLNGREPSDENIARESSVTVLEGVDITQTNMSFFRQQLMQIATHILRCTGDLYLISPPTVRAMCNQALFECLALNLHCLRGDQRALTAVINHRIVSTQGSDSRKSHSWEISHHCLRFGDIPTEVKASADGVNALEPPQSFWVGRDVAAASVGLLNGKLSSCFCVLNKKNHLLLFQRRMSSDISPSLVNWMTSMMTMRLQVILENIPVSQEQVQNYIVYTQEWVPIIRCDMMTQRKMKAQPPLSDAYLHGMPAKRRKVLGSVGASLMQFVFQAARNAGVRPMTSPEQLQSDLETQEVKEAYSEQSLKNGCGESHHDHNSQMSISPQVKADVKKRVREDPDFNSQQFPNAHRAFSPDS
ncbi:hypothetical protein GOODEAATRI_014000, partial [Goodea atripinnis]